MTWKSLPNPETKLWCDENNNVSNNLTEDCDLGETVDTGIAGFAGQVIDFYVTTKEECLAYCVNEV